MIHSNDSSFFERKRWAYELSTCTLQKNYSDTLELVQYLCQDWNFQPLKGHATLLTTEISLQPLQCKLYTNTVSLQVHYQIQCWGLTYLVYPCSFNFFPWDYSIVIQSIWDLVLHISQSSYLRSSFRIPISHNFLYAQALRNLVLISPTRTQ